MNRLVDTLLSVIAAISVGCSTPQAQPSTTSAAPSGEASTTQPMNAAQPPFEGTAGILEVKRDSAAATLVAVRSASHDGFDRVVFEFAVGDAVPGYHIEYIDKPVRDCGEGTPKEVAGDAWLEVRMYPANAHTEAGQPTIAFRDQALGLPIVRELERTCDFEAVTTWVLGVSSPNHYRVQELSDPPRLVVDIAARPHRRNP